jgi:hypothetical protein
MVEDYHFEDFTESNYQNILDLIKKNYNTIFFSDHKKPGKNLLLRHDVDFSIHRAYRLAQIESENNVYSTFFLLIHSPYYSIFEEELYELISQIIDLGHEIGLHFDFGIYQRRGLDRDTIFEYLAFERDTLEKMFKRPIKVFSFHDPSSEVFRHYADDDYCGMINTYSQYLRDNYNYCSDSNGYWRYHRLEDVLVEAKSERLQVLLHPEWWTPEIMSPRERISRCIDGRCRRNHEHYDSQIERDGRLNVR